MKDPETFKGLAVAGVLLHSAHLIWNRICIEEITEDACAEIEKKLTRKVATMQNLSDALVNHCGLSEGQVSKLGIKQGISCFLDLSYLPETAEGLDFMTEQELLYARQR